jgi:HEAT repeat protein
MSARFISIRLLALFVIGLGLLTTRTFGESERTTAEMLKSAASGSKDARYTAIDDLGERHADASQVVPQLMKLLQDEDPQIRWRTVRTLGEYDAQAKAAAADIRKLLGDKDPIVQYHAAVALGKLEDKSEETVQALVDAGTNKDPRVARAAISAIRNLKPGPKRVAEVLGKALKSKDQAITLHALKAMVEAGPAAVPFMKEALKNPDTAYLAATAAEQIGPPAAPAVPELAALLGKTKHSQLLIQTLLALASIGPEAASAAPQIKPLLDSSTDKTVPVAAAYALGSIGGKGADAELKRAAAKDDPFLQMIATWAIAKTHPNDQAAIKAAVEKLTNALKSDNVGMRTAAAKSLQSLGAPPEILAPHLVALINDPNPDVQTNAVDAIAGLGESVVPKVNNGLKNPQLRHAAVRVITKLGPKAAGSVESLIETANGAEPKLRTDIQLALGAIGPAAAPATDMLVKSIKSSDAGERESALYALGKIGPGAKAAIKPLLDRVKSDDSFDALAAALALSTIAPNDKAVRDEIVPELVKGLSNSDEQSRLESIGALVQLKSAGKATAALEKAAKDDGSEVVRAAAEAALTSGGR